MALVKGVWDKFGNFSSRYYYSVNMDTVEGFAKTPFLGIRRIFNTLPANQMLVDLEVGDILYFRNAGSTQIIHFTILGKYNTTNCAGISASGSIFNHFLVSGKVIAGAGDLVNNVDHFFSADNFVTDYPYLHRKFGMDIFNLTQDGFCMRSNNLTFHRDGFAIGFNHISSEGVDFSKFFTNIHDAEKPYDFVYYHRTIKYVFRVEMSYIDTTDKKAYFIGTNVSGSYSDLQGTSVQTDFDFTIFAPQNLVSQNAPLVVGAQKVAGEWNIHKSVPIVSSYSQIDTTITDYQLDAATYEAITYIGFREFDSNGVDANVLLSNLLKGHEFKMKGLPAADTITYSVVKVLQPTTSVGVSIPTGSKIYNFMVRATSSGAVTMGVDVAISVDNFVSQLDYNGMDGFKYVVQDGSFVSNQTSDTNRNGCMLSFSVRSLKGYDFTRLFSRIYLAQKPYDFGFIHNAIPYTFRVDDCSFHENGTVFLMYGTHTSTNFIDLLTVDTSVTYTIVADESDLIKKKDEEIENNR